MVIEQVWGIPMERARSFLAAQPDVLVRDTVFFFCSCRITLEEQPSGYLGKIPFPRTLLRIEGPEDQARIIHRRFLLQFLSAGG